MYINYIDIHQEFKKPLQYKIDKAVEVIKEAFELSKHTPAIAFSGGKDSTVLWHIIRTYFSEKDYKVIFGNTGVEYPESLKFARKLGKEWGGKNFYETKPDHTKHEGLKYQAQKETLEWLISENRVAEVLKADGKLKNTRTLELKATPEMWEDFRQRKLTWKKGTPMTFWWCVDQYGYPILGKSASKLDARRINIDCFLRFSKSSSETKETLAYYDVLKEVKFSQHCCKLLKKDPSEKLQAELDVDVIFKGLMASEGNTRLMNFSVRGYIFKSSRKHLGDDPFFHCNPLSIWTDEDIWEYSKLYNVPQSDLYNMGYIDNKGVEHKIQRNGCFGCATDILFKDNHLKMLRHTHPHLWEYLMSHGYADELKKLYHTRTNGIPTILDVMDDANMLIEIRPCAFDDIGTRLLTDGIDDEYDSEA